MRSLLIAVFACGSLLQADLVVPNGPWQTLDKSNVTASGEQLFNNPPANTLYGAYWNNETQDTGGCANIGCYMLKLGRFSTTDDTYSPNLNSTVWLGEANGAAVANGFSFTGTAQQPIQLLVEVAGNENQNYFGWYDTSVANPFSSTSSWGTIFTGSDSDGSSKMITIPTSTFAFWYLPNLLSSETVPGALGNSSRDLALSKFGGNRGDFVNDQYFALFAESVAGANTPPATFWIGMEDVALNKGSDMDYNDMVVKFTVVPEPGFYGALALGLSGLYLAVRRKKA